MFFSIYNIFTEPSLQKYDKNGFKNFQGKPFFIEQTYLNILFKNNIALGASGMLPFGPTSRH